MVSIQTIQPGGPASTVVDNAPLRRVALDDKSDPCNTNLVIETGLPGERPVTHVIVEPIHIRLKNGKSDDRYHSVHIVAENGITVVEFHPGLSPAILKGLEAGHPD